MENYDELCEPDEHCYHHGEVGYMDGFPHPAMICCHCGHTVKTHLASLAEEPPEVQ